MLSQAGDDRTECVWPARKRLLGEVLLVVMGEAFSDVNEGRTTL